MAMRESRSRAAVLCAALLAAGAVMAWALMSETPRGSVQGVVIAEELGVPIADARVTLSQGYRSEGRFTRRTDARGHFRFAEIPAASYDLEVRSEAHRLRGGRDVTVTEGETLDLRLELQPVDPFMEVSVPTRVFTPDEEPQLRVRGFAPFGDMEMAIYRLSLEATEVTGQTHLAALLGDRRADEDELDLDASDRLERVRRTTEEITGRDGEGVFAMRMDLPRLEPGVYPVALRVGELQRVEVLTVTDLALVCKRMPGSVLAWTVDIATGEPRPGLSVEAVREDTLLAEGVTDSDGLVKLALESAEEEAEGRIVIRAGDGPSTAAVEGWYRPWSSEEEGYRVYSYTDRPAYRSGHDVHFKGIVRELEEGGYGVPADLPVEVQVRDDMDNLVHTASLHTSEMGSFHGTLSLSDAALPGVYALKTAVAGEPHYSRFVVAEYRKPEWEVEVGTSRERYVRGDPIEVTATASYFYGAPVADAEVRYYVTRSEAWWWPEDEGWAAEGGYFDYYGDYGGGEVVTTGEGRTDSAGRFRLSVPTTFEEEEERRRGPSDWTYRIEVQVTDASRRSVSASHRVLVVQGAFRVQVEAEPSILHVGRETTVTIRTIDYDDNPVQANGEVRLELSEWSEDEEHFEERAVADWQTGADGTATVTFTPGAEGSYRVLATTRDSRGNRITGSTWLWVARRARFTYDYPYGELDLVADRRSYSEGETARILINTELVPTTALLTVESSRIHSRRLVKLRENSTVVEVELKPEWAPNCWVSVAFVHDKRFVEEALELRIEPQSRTLELEVSSDRRQYRPGDAAVYTVRATDAEGRPARAEVSLAVVDQALFALYPDRTQEIVDAFYPRRSHRVYTDFSFPMIYLSDGWKGAGAQIETRRRFRDTAFWAPSAVTNEAGEATFEFALPDNLTTWRATARAHTAQTLVGQSTHEAVVTKPFLVRLEAPRFITQGDRLRVGGVVHNRTDGSLQAEVGLDGDYLTIDGRPQQSGAVAAGEARRFEWEVEAPAVGDQTVRVWAKAGELEDAMQRAIPVLPFGRRRVELRSGAAGGRTVEVLPVRKDVIEGTPSLTVRLTPSIASAMLGSLDYLAQYPYGCIEQTTSSFLPDVIIARMLDEFGIEEPELRQRLPKMVERGLLKIYDYQRGHDGWGWWGYDDQDPWMTAYVVFALVQAREAGFEVTAPVLVAGIGRLAELYEKGTLEATDMAWVAYTLAVAGRGDVVRAASESNGVQALVDRVREAPVRSRALACLALHAMDEEEPARDLLRKLWREAESTGGLISWEAHGGVFSDAETTALALSAGCRLTPDDTRLSKVVRWLLVHRRGDHWYSTRDTAFVLYALADYLRVSGELSPDFIATVTVGEREVFSGRFTAEDVFRPERVVEVPPELLRPGNVEVAVERASPGAGRLYYTLELSQHVRADLATPVTGGSALVLERTYRQVKTPARRGLALLDQTVPGRRTRYRSGDVVEVTLTVRAGRAHEFLVIEDPIPAGCEVIDRGRLRQWEWDRWWSDQIVRDEMVAFAVKFLPIGARTLSYRMRAEVPGRYRAMPTVAYNMYDPTVRSYGAADEFVIEP
ncbi:MAG: alpha-2-macroglobulin family protein [Armatimonadota bacterium]|nr:alpha-2-macroglobulin family protein [Armatimonadota bacterium]